jgi:cohesin complex subunit SCC1
VRNFELFFLSFLTRGTASPLSEVPVTPPADVEMGAPVVVVGEQQLEQPDGPVAEEKRKRKKKQIFDDLTELEGRGRGGLGPLNAMDVSSILTDHQYLPRSSVVMRLLEIREDPIAHFLPTKVTPNGTFFFAGPPGIAPELQEMFMRPVATYVPSSKRRGASPEKPPSKRARIEPEGEGSVILEDDGEPGQARRASVAPSQGVGSEMLGRGSIGPGFEFDNTGLGMEDFQMDIGREDLPPVELIREKSVAPSELTRISRASTPALEEGEGNETYADLECPIVAFDTKSSSQVSETDSTDGKGYSKNTIRALGIVRKELEPVEGEGEEKVMSFKYMATKVRFFSRALTCRAYSNGELGCRRLAALRLRSFSSSSSWVRATAFNYPNHRRLRTLRFARGPNYGIVDGMDLLRHLYLHLWDCKRNGEPWFWMRLLFSFTILALKLAIPSSFLPTYLLCTFSFRHAVLVATYAILCFFLSAS